MRDNGCWLWGAALIVASLPLAAEPAQADVVTRSESGFVIRLASEVTAPPAEVWKTILVPAQWWQSQHTFSGDAANLTLEPQVGGCFCEVLPPPDGAPAAQKPGGVQHMRVVYLEPQRAMRLVGALGPLQSEALAATMTITVKPTEKGARILFEYVVGGFMRYKVDEIAPAVDRMLGAQLASLAGKLGPVTEAAGTAPAVRPEGDPAGSGGPARPVTTLRGAETFSLPPSGPRSAAKPAAAVAAKAEPQVAPNPPPRPAPRPAPKPETKSEQKPPAPATGKEPGAATSAAKAPIRASYMAPVKALAPTSARPAAATSAKPLARKPARPAAKPAPKAPDPEAEAQRNVTAAFDAALGTKQSP